MVGEKLKSILLEAPAIFLSGISETYLIEAKRPSISKSNRTRYGLFSEFVTSKIIALYLETEYTVCFPWFLNFLRLVFNRSFPCCHISYFSSGVRVRRESVGWNPSGPVSSIAQLVFLLFCYRSSVCSLRNCLLQYRWGES
jgi:hypothetical protein